MTTENALPSAETSAAAGAQSSDATNTELQQAQADLAAAEGKQPDAEAGKEGEPKKEKTEAERELARLKRRVDNLTRQKYELQARLVQPSVAQPTIERDNGNTQGDDETLSLSRAELQRLIDQRAREVAPTIQNQQAEIERRREVVQSLAKDLGQEKFDALAADLDDALGGLADNGQPKPVALAIFESDSPRDLIEYLADPDNADEAARIGRLGAVQAGRAIARLEAKLAADKANAKPQPSKAPAPIEPLRGGGVVQKAEHQMSDSEWFAQRQKRRA